MRTALTVISGTLTASELLAEGSCSPQCLLGREPDGCTCRCRGEYHGSLRSAEVLPAASRGGARDSA